MRVASLKGLGPRSAEALLGIGIESIQQLRARDPFEVYAELKVKVPGTSLNFLYALIGAIDDVHWQEVKRTRRTEILLRLDEMGIAPR
jgi:DNA transformation protein